MAQLAKEHEAANDVAADAVAADFRPEVAAILTDSCTSCPEEPPPDANDAIAPLLTYLAEAFSDDPLSCIEELRHPVRGLQARCVVCDMNLCTPRESKDTWIHVNGKNHQKALAKQREGVLPTEHLEAPTCLCGHTCVKRKLHGRALRSRPMRWMCPDVEGGCSFCGYIAESSKANADAGTVAEQRAMTIGPASQATGEFEAKLAALLENQEEFGPFAMFELNSSTPGARGPWFCWFCKVRVPAPGQETAYKHIEGAPHQKRLKELGLGAARRGGGDLSRQQPTTSNTPALLPKPAGACAGTMSTMSELRSADDPVFVPGGTPGTAATAPADRPPMIGARNPPKIKKGTRICTHWWRGPDGPGWEHWKDVDEWYKGCMLGDACTKLHRNPRDDFSIA